MTKLDSLLTSATGIGAGGPALELLRVARWPVVVLEVLEALRGALASEERVARLEARVAALDADVKRLRMQVGK